MIHNDALSIWEIAHRWHEHDPNISDPKALPLEVQDTLRLLTRKMAYHELSSCSSKGVRYTIDADIEDREEIMSHRKNVKNLSQGEKDGIYEDYLTYMDNKMTRHNKVIDGFDLCFEQRIYDKDKLDHSYTLQYDLANLCASYDIKLPDFWFPENWNKAPSKDTEDQEGKKLRPNVLAKQLCQAIASTLWAEYPEFTIKQIITHPSLKRFGNGSHYKERTLRLWVKDLDPRPEGTRLGRPKKLQSN